MEENGETNSFPSRQKLPGSSRNSPKLSHAAITTLREKLEAMGYSGLDTLGLLKSSPQGGCGVPPQAVLAASPPPIFPAG
ncbi:MAG: hypothetical protein NTW21_36740 [Verrucomicrobia bacterium]|nr:hypothetical protein [Verrucomicrobiota bacterium]